jgi:hypothetical protein
MADFLFLMHNDAPDPVDTDAWGPYLAGLQAAGRLGGGSAVDDGVCVRKVGPPGPLTAHLGGYIRVETKDLDEARGLLVGNPVFEAGGTVEIRHLPRTD